MTSKPTYTFLFAIIIFLSSCSSAYKIGQTPDDVYYSPARPEEDGYVTTYTDEDKNGYAYNNDNVEDLAIRRGIDDPLYRNSLSLDDGYGMPYDYYGSFMNPYAAFNPYVSFYPYNYFYPYTAGITFYPYSSYNYFGGYYSPYNNYYDPYYSHTISAGNYGITPRRYNLAAYHPATTSRTTTPASVRTFNQRPATSGIGGFVRRIFTPVNNGSTINNNSNSQRSFTPSFSSPSRSSGSGSSGGGGGGSVRSFRH